MCIRDSAGILTTLLGDPTAPNPSTGLIGFHLTAGGAPAGATSISTEAQAIMDATVVSSPSGDVTAFGRRYSSATGAAPWIMDADGANPVLTGVSAPTSLTPGQAGAFAATATDTRSAIARIEWAFGDGATATSAPGQEITHPYGAAGTFTVTARAVDGVGHVSDPQTRTVSVPAPPPAPPITTTPPPATTPVAPRIPAVLRGRFITMNLDVALRRGQRVCPSPRGFATTVRPLRRPALRVARRSVRVVRVRVNGTLRCRITGRLTLRSAPAPRVRTTLRLTTTSKRTVARTVRVTLPRR